MSYQRAEKCACFFCRSVLRYSETVVSQAQKPLTGDVVFGVFFFFFFLMRACFSKHKCKLDMILSWSLQMCVVVCCCRCRCRWRRRCCSLRWFFVDVFWCFSHCENDFMHFSSQNTFFEWWGGVGWTGSSLRTCYAGWSDHLQMLRYMILHQTKFAKTKGLGKKCPGANACGCIWMQN